MCTPTPVEGSRRFLSHRVSADIVNHCHSFVTEGTDPFWYLGEVLNGTHYTSISYLGFTIFSNVILITGLFYMKTSILFGLSLRVIPKDLTRKHYFRKSDSDSDKYLFSNMDYLRCDVL